MFSGPSVTAGRFRRTISSTSSRLSVLLRYAGVNGCLRRIIVFVDAMHTILPETHVHKTHLSMDGTRVVC